MLQPRVCSLYGFYNPHLRNNVAQQPTLLASGMEASAAVPMDATNHAVSTAGNAAVGHAADGVPRTSAGNRARPLLRAALEALLLPISSVAQVHAAADAGCGFCSCHLGACGGQQRKATSTCKPHEFGQDSLLDLATQ